MMERSTKYIYITHGNVSKKPASLTVNTVGSRFSHLHIWQTFYLKYGRNNLFLLLCYFRTLLQVISFSGYLFDNIIDNRKKAKSKNKKQTSYCVFGALVKSQTIDK